MPSAEHESTVALTTLDPATVGSRYRSELFRALAAEHEEIGEARGEAIGEARGKALGEAQALLTVLDARGLAVPTDLRDQILACTDLNQLDAWLRRALVATSADEITRP